MKPVFFNGKFYSGRMNGVHRVADRLIREVDARLGEMPAGARPEMRLVLPEAAQWQPRLSHIELMPEPGGCGQRWEQSTLPWKTRHGVLVNLCNLAPVAHPNKLLMLHDAQFLFPDSSYPWRQQTGYRLLTPRMARTSRRVLTVSHYSRQMLDLFGVSPRERTHVLYNGVDHITETPADPALVESLGLNGRPFVLMFGSPKAYKNNQVVLDAFTDRRLADIRLVIVGPARVVLEEAGLRIPPATLFAGGVNDAQLRGLYERALCIAFPSRTEGFGLPPAEAALCGCPAVVAPSGAIPEVCRDSVAYADVDDSAGWAEAIARYAGDPDHRCMKQDAARRRMGAFTWARAGEGLLGHILDLARTERPKA